jgi:hypothetical protein
MKILETKVKTPETMKHSVRHAATAYLVGNCGIDRRGGKRADGGRPGGGAGWSGNDEAQPSREAEEGRRLEGPREERHLPARPHCTIVLVVGLQSVVEKMKRKRRPPATSLGHGAGWGGRKWQG